VVEIVRAGAADRETVLVLVERLLRELEDEPEEFLRLDRAKILRDLEAAGERFTALLAVEGGTPVGVLTLTETFAIYAGGRFGVIDEMYVEAGHRGEGVGRRLIEAALQLGRQRGWIRIDVTAPPGPRWERTVRFYEKQGFLFTGPKLRRRLTGI
jgi:GNAT superfamily N-acetyltransferase